MYKRKKYRYSNIIEIHEYHSARYGAPGEKREAKTKPTPEAVRRQNQRRREEKADRIIAANFEKGDLVRTLTFARDERPPDMKTAQEIFRKFYTKLKKEYRKRFYDLYWMANIECTERGAWHIHFLCNKIFGASDIIKELWQENGGVYDQTLRDLEGKKLGAYFTKTPESTEEGEHKVTEAKFSHSRNLEIPEPEEKLIAGWKITDQPRAPKGYYLIKDSYYEGVNEEGYRYRRYKFAGPPVPPKDRRWRPPERKRNEGRHLHRGRRQRAEQTGKVDRIPDDLQRQDGIRSGMLGINREQCHHHHHDRRTGQVHKACRHHNPH